MKLLITISLFIFLGACAHHRGHHHGGHHSMSADQHNTMAKAHQDTSACLNDKSKNEKDCHAIMEKAMSEIKASYRKACKGKSGGCKLGKDCKDKNKKSGACKLGKDCKSKSATCKLGKDCKDKSCKKKH